MASKESLQKSYKTIVNHFFQYRKATNCFYAEEDEEDDAEEVDRVLDAWTDLTARSRGGTLEQQEALAAEFNNVATESMKRNLHLLEILRSDDSQPNAYNVLQHFFQYLCRKRIRQTGDDVHVEDAVEPLEAQSPWYTKSTIEKYFTTFKSFLNKNIRQLGNKLNNDSCNAIKYKIVDEVEVRSQRYAVVDNTCLPMSRLMKNELLRSSLAHNGMERDNIMDTCLVTYSWHVFGRSSDCDFVQKRQLDASDGVLKVFFSRMKTKEFQHLSLVHAMSWYQDPVLAMAMISLLQDRESKYVFAHVPAVYTSAQLDVTVEQQDTNVSSWGDYFLGEMENNRSGAAALLTGSTAEIGSVRSQGISAYITAAMRCWLTDLKECQHDVEGDCEVCDECTSLHRVPRMKLSSQSNRKGAANELARSTNIPLHAIAERGAWNITSFNRVFMYMVNRSEDDLKVACLLSEINPDTYQWIDTTRTLHPPLANDMFSKKKMQQAIMKKLFHIEHNTQGTTHTIKFEVLQLYYYSFLLHYNNMKVHETFSVPQRVLECFFEGVCVYNRSRNEAPPTIEEVKESLSITSTYVFSSFQLRNMGDMPVDTVLGLRGAIVDIRSVARNAIEGSMEREMTSAVSLKRIFDEAFRGLEARIELKLQSFEDKQNAFINECREAHALRSNTAVMLPSPLPSTLDPRLEIQQGEASTDRDVLLAPLLDRTPLERTDLQMVDVVCNYYYYQRYKYRPPGARKATLTRYTGIWIWGMIFASDFQVVTGWVENLAALKALGKKANNNFQKARECLPGREKVGYSSLYNAINKFVRASEYHSRIKLLPITAETSVDSICDDTLLSKEERGQKLFKFAILRTFQGLHRKESIDELADIMEHETLKSIFRLHLTGVEFNAR